MTIIQAIKIAGSVMQIAAFVWSIFLSSRARHAEAAYMMSFSIMMLLIAKLP